MIRSRPLLPASGIPESPASTSGPAPTLASHPDASCSPPVAPRLEGGGDSRGSGRSGGHLRSILGAALLVVSPFLLACEKEVTLIEPPPFFAFDPANAWSCQGSFRGPATVPPPEGLFISVCPNPAPPGTREIRIDFTLEIQTPGVNLAIVDNRGLIVRELLLGFRVEKDVPQTVRWLLDGVDPGDYRAYFTAGQIETSGDIRVD